MELISNISSYTNPSAEPINYLINNQKELITKNIIKNHLNEQDIEKHFELDKIKQENIEKYNDIKSNIILLDEVIDELETKSNKILESIKNIENIYNESIKLYTNITR